MDITDLARPLDVGRALSLTLGDDRWLSSRAELISGGKSNLTFEIISDAGSVILRRPPTGPLLRGAHDVIREARIQKALRCTGVPVPHVVLEEAQPGTLDSPFFVMTKLPGVVLRDQLPTDYSERPDHGVMLADALVDALVALHAVAPSTVGLDNMGRPGGFMSRQVRTWTRQWEATRTHDLAAVDELAERLAAQVWTEPAAPVIVHGDYRLDNCLFDGRDPSRLTGILDWELASIGDPLADLALLLFYWAEAGEPKPLLTPSLTSEPGFPTRTHVATRYAEQTGRDLTNLQAYLAYAHFKFAAITQGIAQRVAGNQMAGQHFGDLDAEVERLGRAGLDIINRTELTNGL